MLDLSKETPLRIDDVAELFKVHRRTVDNWLRQGLEKKKLGRLVYTSREAIERFSERQREPQPEQSSPQESKASKSVSQAARKRHRI